MTYGELIRGYRQIREMTLEDVAKEIGTHKGYISGIEHGKVNPPAAKMTCKLAALFGLPAEDLLELAWAEKAPKKIKERVLKRIADNGLLRIRFNPPTVVTG